MKRKDIKLLHQKSLADLTKELAAKRSELSKLYMERSTKKEKNTRLARTLTDDVARIATVMAEISGKRREKA